MRQEHKQAADLQLPKARKWKRIGRRVVGKRVVGSYQHDMQLQVR